MSSDLPQTTQGQQFQFSDFGPAHAGVMLAQARAQRGLSLEELGAQLKVPVRKLEQLEAGQFAEIAGGMAYVRALCRAVCRALKTDEGPVLERMPQVHPQASLPEQDLGLRAPFADSERMGRLGVRSPGPLGRSPRPRNPWVWSAGVVLIGAAALLAWPWLHAHLPERVIAAMTPSSPRTTETVDAAIALTAAPALEPRAAGAPADNAAPVASAAEAPATGPAVPTVAASAPVAGEGLTIEAVQPTWVEIRGADGALIISRNLGAGERIEQGLDRKRNIVIGNAAGTQVWVRGASMDIHPYVRNNVARFDVR